VTFELAAAAGGSASGHRMLKFFQYGADASASSNAALTSALTSLIVPGFDIFLTVSSLGLGLPPYGNLEKPFYFFQKAPAQRD
jgi:hypothetical protein